ncbi:OmpA family protein [Marinilongibacter aquaticus]|uniref:OmpA family protein n=1 Tax=Marinilongibacter aquaticus TaxID=2975157 RepID=UPI0021BD9167|nr:OmpA family protein [Marinilongibacter aquaticus]UBM60278.1 OmpA family protein [Marinilongibacter aquaticus]
MKNIHFQWALAFCFLLYFNADAQLQAYKKGLQSFDKGFYELAINDLQKVKEIDASQEAKLNYTLAEAYRLSNRWVPAIPYYEKAIAEGIEEPEAHFYYAYALKVDEQYQKASEQFKKYVEQKTPNKELNEWANRELSTLQIIDLLKDKSTDIQFRNLAEVNTEGAEFSPIIHKGQLVFTSSRKDKMYANGLPFVGLYAASVNPDYTQFGEVGLFSKNIFDPERNEGSPAFSPDGKIVVFARGNSGKRKDHSPDVDLYISRNVPGEGWTEPQLVSASDSASWDGCPAFSGDGKTIYFSSNRPGGSGGMDLYRVNMDASGRFGNPANMGKTLNTPGDEMFPFVSQDGKLYFASDGHPGLGKLDLFVAVRKSGKISVENLGLPYNSSRDDFGLTEDGQGNIFFSSNREGGKGDDDIYFYKAPAAEVVVDVPVKEEPEEEEKIVNYYLKGEVLDSDNKAVLANTRIDLYKIEGGFQELDSTLTTNEKGVFGPIPMQEETDYLMLVSKEEYLTKREGFSMYGRSIPQILLRKSVTDTTFNTVIDLSKIFVGKTFVINNIYYDLDKADIRPDAAIELDKIVQILLDNPKLKIELGSHTDSRGTDMYNLRLSQRRAESAIEYIISRGIDRDRLVATGYGETELIIENAKTEEEHQVNRRTEFKILDLGENPSNK